MDISNLIMSMEESLPKIFTEEGLQDLKSHAELLIERDTFMSGTISLFKFKHVFIVQEISSKKDLVLRKYKNLGSAQDFISKRMDIYEKMWDGCGCKIDYYK